MTDLVEKIDKIQKERSDLSSQLQAMNKTSK